jgi:glycine/sarcosine N-methyltransferase
MSEGLEVKALDISQSMIAVAQSNAAKFSMQLDAVCTDWVDMKETIQGKFDCIICLGNSLACEMDASKRQIAVQNWSSALTDDGVLIVDRRNYETLLAGQRYSNSNGQYFGETVKIGYDKIIDEETVFSYTFSDGQKFSLKMFPILDHQIKLICRNAGLEPVEIYGDRALSHIGEDVAFYSYVFRKIRTAQL